ncbi:hypothetical protein [Methylococcus capsulatus]|uniref:hypothetical protein n=1 Tax=Methylococcus capsulatus TaxID=414 RepID=UPI001C52E03F|nr:hypothetical protein [Methylococcus capsulatus]QXP87708.1 hypothetical protein KW112_00685 [Methylococcus capsulatus]
MMETRNEEHASEHAAAVGAIATAAARGELDMERLGEILSGHYGEVNCYPGKPTNACHNVAYFIALEGLAGSRLRSDARCDEWEREFHHHHRFHGGDWYGIAHILDRFVRHMQGGCAGMTRQAVIITDAWDPIAYGYWRANIAQIRKTAAVEIHLVGDGGLKQRIL